MGSPSSRRASICSTSARSPARSGPPVAAADEAARLVPAIERLVAERRACPVSADTF